MKYAKIAVINGAIFIIIFTIKIGIYITLKRSNVNPINPKKALRYTQGLSAFGKSFRTCF